MKIANNLMIGTKLNDSIVGSRNTSDIGADIGIFRGKAANQVCQAAGVNSIQLQGWIDAFGIDIAAVVTSANGSLVFPGNASDIA